MYLVCMTLSAPSRASHISEAVYSRDDVQGQMSGASADFPQSGQHGQLAVSTSTLPSSTAQLVTAAPGRMCCKHELVPKTQAEHTAPDIKALSVVEQATHFYGVISNHIGSNLVSTYCIHQCVVVCLLVTQEILVLSVIHRF